MKNLFLLLTFTTTSLFAQSIEDTLSVKNMYKDLTLFKEIRIKTNSGLYKYRTKTEIDSIYKWAFNEINEPKPYREFYNIICSLTDFEGSAHNATNMSDKSFKILKNEKYGYFPFPVKLIEDKLIINIKDKEIPLGSEVISINNLPINIILPKLYKYYTTDGANVTGKYIAINNSFSKLYRLHYGRIEKFDVVYKKPASELEQKVILESSSNKNFYKNVTKRHSKPFDHKTKEKYSFEKLNNNTSILTINTFSIGGGKNDLEHLAYVSYLDSVFLDLKNNKTKNLIVDVRQNGGGSDPNDLVTYSYLTNRNFSENKQAWISFKKIPVLKHIESKIPAFLRPLGVRKYNKMFQSLFPIEKDGKYYQGLDSEDHEIRTPNKNAFKGNVYLLISPRVASAGSLFAAMVAGNPNTKSIGEETLGGYYGHNGHTPLTYILPKSKIKTSFFIVNLEQDVIEKDNQFYNRGIIPDYPISQTYSDFLVNKDTQLKFTLDLINKNH